jgi:hypothetical protein
MNALLVAQLKFCRMLAALLTRATELQLPLKLGCALCQNPHHSRNSLHRDSLAIDLPMVWPDGRYGVWTDYLPLGEYWESLGGSWGGRFDLNGDGVAKDDANHFSLQYGNRK